MLTEVTKVNTQDKHVIYVNEYCGDERADKLLAAVHGPGGSSGSFLYNCQRMSG